MTAQIGFDVITYTPSADVATNGTAVFNYPAGRLKTDYAQNAGEVLISHGLQTSFVDAAGGFSITYGASSATLTYLGSTNLPAGKSMTLQLPLAQYLAVVDSSGGAASGGLAAGVGVSQLALFVNFADLATGDLVTALKPGFNGKILGIHAIVDKAVTTGAKLATLTPKINATNVTEVGGLALTSALLTPQGAKVDGAAITALNVFGPTDTIGIVASAVTTFVEGSGWIILDIQNMDVANAFAALAAKVNTLIANAGLFDKIPH